MAVRILDETLINTIAAGEVVERPASVVKELVENALDASALDVRVALAAGGRDLVRITDDGSGMDRADAMMCLERHATSKITSADDLFRIATLGFRGEAIPSIAAVSRFELTTRPHDREEGTRVAVEGGKLLDVGPAGTAPGTDIVVRDLFYNVPARRKFLRTSETELGHCLEVLQREALVRPDVGWELTNDGHTSFRWAPTEDWSQRIADVLGPHGATLVPADFTRGTLEVRARISPVGVHRQSATGSTWIYVNGRYVKDPVLRRAVTTAYGSIVPKGRWPVVVIDLQVPPADVDVNVSPAKTEVRFQNAWAIQNALTEGLRHALRAGGIRVPVANEARYRPAGEGTAARRSEPVQVGLGIPAPIARPRVEEAFDSWGGGGTLRNASPVPSGAPSAGGEVRVAGEAPQSEGRPHTEAQRHRERQQTSAQPELRSEVGVTMVHARGETTGPHTETQSFSENQEPVERPCEVGATSAEAHPERAEGPGGVRPPWSGVPGPVAGRGEFGNNVPANALLPVPRWRDLHVLGQLAATYIVCEGRGEMVLVDQHAAHERIQLVRLRNDARALGNAQRLLVPVMVRLPPAAARHLTEQVDELARIGLDVSPLGGNDFALQAVPGLLAKAHMPTLLADLATEGADEVHGMAVRGPIELALATMSCHSAVKAGQELTHHEMRAILAALDEVDFEVCAHGRPVAIRIGNAELERRFHRT